MSYTVNSGTVAAKVVRVRIQDQLSNCYQSTDYFTIRPTELWPTLTAGANPMIAGKSSDGFATGFTLLANARSGWNTGASPAVSTANLTAGYAAAPTVEWATNVTDWTGAFVTDYATKITNSLSTTNLAAAAGSPVVAGPTTFYFDDFGTLSFSGKNVVDDQTFTFASGDWVLVLGVPTGVDCIINGVAANSAVAGNSYSNVADASGKYGCYVGSTALSGTTATNRFRPYSYAAQSGLGTPACGGFYYVGQYFNGSGGGTLSLTAKSASGTTMGRLNGSSLTTGSPTYAPAYYFVPYNGASAISGFSGASIYTNSSGSSGSPLPSSTSTASTWANGVVTYNSSNYLLLKGPPSVTPTPPFGPYTSFSVGVVLKDYDLGLTGTAPVITSCQDNSGNTVSAINTPTTSTCVPPAGGTANLRFGMLKIENAYGSEKVPLNVPVKALYWDAITTPPTPNWKTNTLDSCSSFNVGTNLSIGNYRGTLVAGDTTASSSPSPLKLVSGVGAIAFSTPASGHTGSADVELDLFKTTDSYAATCVTWDATPSPTNANMDYLQGNWCGTTTSFTKNPSARITFGMSKSPFLYQREKY
jgi:hypothetical protein